MKIGSLMKDAFILCAITLVLGLALSGAKVATQPLIDKAAEESKIKAFNEVCKGFYESEDITDKLTDVTSDFSATLAEKEGVLKVYDESKNVLGYIVQCTSSGFGGKLNLIIGFDTDGKVTGVKYANTPSETPGVGMKTTKPEFLNSWVGHDTNDVSSVDTISGATISSTAFKEAVSMACLYASKAKEVQ